jgi:hypothetical protein
MGLLLAFGRGTAVTAIVLLAFALLKKLVVVFGILFALIKFGILIAFMVLFVSIAVAMLRDWSCRKDEIKSS